MKEVEARRVEAEEVRTVLRLLQEEAVGPIWTEDRLQHRAEEAARSWGASTISKAARLPNLRCR